MANTIDNFTLKVNVEGTAEIKGATADIQNLDKASQASAKGLNAAAGSIRNVGFQVQDFTVQVANGTSAITALSQQLPQLLSNFGTIGVYLGIAAAAIPIVVAGFRLLGGDSRDLNERIKDLADSTQRFQDAQRQNLPTLKGLGNEYGNLTAAAKDFFMIQQDLLKIKAEFELTSSLRKLRSEFAIFSPDLKKLNEELGTIGAGYATSGLEGIGTAIKRANLGLTAEQAKYLAEQINTIDPTNAEQTATVFNNILKYLKETGVEGDKFLKFWNETIEPIVSLNRQVLELNKNIKESAERARDANIALLNLQSSFIPRIGEAKRNFDQITALRLEGEQRVAEFTRQAQEQTAKDQVDRAAEIAAFRNRVAVEVRDREKDVAKAQYETFRGSYLTLDSKIRQIELDQSIVDILEKGRYSLQANVQLDADRARINKEYFDTLLNIDEQLRKNAITEAQAASLRREALQAQTKGYELAEANRQRRLADMRDAQTASMFEMDSKSISLDADRKILEIRQALRNAYPEQIDNAVKIAQLTQQQADYERKLLEDVRLGKITREDANERIQRANMNLEQALRLQQMLNEEASRYRLGTGEQGLEDTLAKIGRDIPSEYQKAGQKVQSVFDNLGSALDNFVRTGKISFGDLARSIISDIIRIEMRATYSSLFSSSGGLLKRLLGIGGGDGNISYVESPLGLGPIAMAKGGIVNKPTFAMIGEAGPEAVIPLNQLPQAASITYNINAVDAASFRTLVARDPQFIYSVTEAGRRSQPTRRLA